MNALLLNFSGRASSGNCSSIMDFLSERLNLMGIHSSKLSLKDLNIHPCCGCDYECFNDNLKCPFIEDDTFYLYNKILESDLTIMIVPTYSEAPPSTYFAFRERSQCFFKDYFLYDKYKAVIKAFIVIGKKISGGEETIDILLNEEKNLYKDKVLLLESNKYNQSALDGTLMNCYEVKRDIMDFIENLILQVWEV